MFPPMQFGYGQEVVRLRRKRVPDPYNPESTRLGGWDDADELVIPGAYVASNSSSAQVGADRVEILTAKSLICDPYADVRELDRIRAAGITYEVIAVPSADTNPWTGWQPVRKVPLQVVEG